MNETLVHGAEICGEYLDDMEMTAETTNEKPFLVHCFIGFIQKAIVFKFGDQGKNLIKELVKMIAFDSSVGNNDRHFYNWGVITSAKKVDLKPDLPHFMIRQEVCGIAVTIVSSTTLRR